MTWGRSLAGGMMLLLAVFPAAAAPPQPPSSRALLAPLVRTIAVGVDLDPALADALVQQESGYNPTAISSAGAMGLTQLMPATARAYGVRNAYDPTENLIAGLFHFRQLLHRYKDVRLALAAYHAGEPAVNRHGGVPPWPKTREYVMRILARTALTTPMTAFSPPSPSTSAGPAVQAAPQIAMPPSPREADTSVDLSSIYPERVQPLPATLDAAGAEPIVLTVRPPAEVREGPVPEPSADE